MTAIPKAVRQPETLQIKTFSFDVACDAVGLPFDGKNYPMPNGYAYLDPEGTWKPTNPNRVATEYERIEVNGGSELLIRIFSNSMPDGHSPKALVVSSYPALDDVATGQDLPFAGPWDCSGSNLCSSVPMVPRTGGVRSEGIGKDFQNMWVFHCPKLVKPSLEIAFSLTVALSCSTAGKTSYFLTDPELIIRGDG